MIYIQSLEHCFHEKPVPTFSRNALTVHAAAQAIRTSRLNQRCLMRGRADCARVAQQDRERTLAAAAEERRQPRNAEQPPVRAACSSASAPSTRARPPSTARSASSRPTVPCSASPRALVPNRFDLQAAQLGAAVHAEVLWRTANRCGVAFREVAAVRKRSPLDLAGRLAAHRRPARPQRLIRPSRSRSELERTRILSCCL